MSFGTVAVRGLVGSLFMGHGAQKLWGKFGGHGLEGTGQFFESQLGLSPGRKHAQAAGLAEFGGGALIAAGALTPVASTLISSTMITAIRKVHGSKGPWVTEGGWEYNAVLIGVATLLADRGPGAPSVDSALFPRMHGAKWALASLAAAAAGSLMATSEKFPPAPVEQALDAIDVDARFSRDDVSAETPSSAS
jgi:putative oxidoreductase